VFLCILQLLECYIYIYIYVYFFIPVIYGEILGSFTDLIKDIILCDTVLNNVYTLNHSGTKYTLDDTVD